MINSSKKLRQIFSNVAHQYNRHAVLQSQIGKNLLTNLNGARCSRILDIGMGTGNLTKEITNLYPEAEVFGCDFAEKMVLNANNQNIFYALCTDASDLCFKNNFFDLAISNLMYQWVYDLNKAFYEVKRILNDNGEFIFSCFSEGTLKELLEAHSVVLNNNPKPWLVSKDKLMKYLKEAGFRDIELNCYSLTENYKNIFELVSWLKKIGANRIGESRFLGKDAWQAMDNYYKLNFSNDSGVFATFEVIEVKAKK